MMRLRLPAHIWCTTLLSFFLLATATKAEAAKPLLLAHYMPWYASKAVSGAWGWHWTMDHFAPDKMLWDGKREVASHDYPLIGAYDSGDAAALECQVLLMKFAGLDGVILDWYGVGSVQDHPAIHGHVIKLIPWLKRAGLRFALCYEDQALKSMEPGEGLAQASKDLRWVEKEWFGDPSYVRLAGRPLLLVFGPQHLPSEWWQQQRTSLVSRPFISGLPHLWRIHGLDGGFAWPPVADGKALSSEQWRQELARLYAPSAMGEHGIATAFPGYKDIYATAGVRSSYGSIAPKAGATFVETLDMALKSGAPIVQIATWNDYGEGTMIEPTRNHGYRHLECLQRLSKAHGVADLRLPVQLYQLRKRGGDSATLDKAAALLFDGKCLDAEAILASVGRKLGEQDATFAETPGEPDPGYRLTTEVLYRDEQGATDAMHQRCRLDVYAPAAKRASPTVVWFHGGGLTQGERSIPLPLRRQGLIVVSVNYRLSPAAKSPIFIEDAAAAVAWVYQHIGEFGGSKDKIFVSGHSAGAYLATLVVLDKKWLVAHGLDANRLAGLIPLSGQMITHYTIREERGIEETQPIIDDLAPLFHLRKDAPPMLLVTGDREKELMGRYEENAYFWRMAKLVGHLDVTLHELDGFDHGKMPEPAFPLLRQFIESRANKAKRK
ncbi:MAG: alpha/beta hydrolase fold domain-containing protein [Roseimicrobium sp.]